MKIIIFNLLKIVLPVVFAIGIAGCSSKNYNNDSYKNYKNNHYSKKRKLQEYIPKPPKTFEIRVALENGEITFAKVLHDIEKELGVVQADGVYFYLDEPVLKLVSSKHLNYYWTVKLPIVSNGVYNKTAYIQDKDILYEEVEAPLAFKIVIEAKDKSIVDHYIKDSKYYWGEFDFEKIDKEKKRAYFTNVKYPKYLWGLSYKDVDNGRYVLTAKVIKGNHYEF